jgi:hypothetical protein
MSELFAFGKSQDNFFHSYIIQSIINNHSDNRIDDYWSFEEENESIELFSIKKNGEDNSFIGNSNEKPDNSLLFNYNYQNEDFCNIKTDDLYYYSKLHEKNESFSVRNFQSSHIPYSMNEIIGISDDDKNNEEKECSFSFPNDPKEKDRLFTTRRPGTRLNDEDNIAKKIKTNYINFDFEFINFLLMKKGRKEFSFQEVKQKHKIIVRKSILRDMKNLKLEDVLCNEIEDNKKQLEKIKKEPNLRDILYILNQNFLFLFGAVYFPKRKDKYNLKEFDINLESFEFVLSKKIKLYEDLVEKNKRKPNFPEYKKKMDICCKKYFFPKSKYPIFITRKIKRKKKK